MSDNDKKTDYLEVDESIPGQNYVCLSFVSPEAVIESKEAFKVSKFLQSICKDKDMDVEKTIKEYSEYVYKYQDELQKDFDERNDFQTNVRGLKVRGTYNTKEEAEKRAKTLQSIDSSFHVFVGEVGYWLPWDPCADKVQDEYYIDSQLNEMMEKYKENNINRDIFYEQEKRDKVKKAREEALQKKKEQAEMEAEEKAKAEEKGGTEENIASVDEILDKKDITDTEECVEEVIDGNKEGEDIVLMESNKKEGECEKSLENEKVDGDIKESFEGEKVDADIKESFDAVDPWMANKMKK